LVEHGHGKNLCFGILWDDELTVPHPPVRRGLEETKQALIAAGHKGQDSFIVLYFPYIRNSNRLETLEAYGNLQGRRKRPPPDSMRLSSVSLIISCQLQGAIWAAAAGEDYRVATLPSGEPVIATMNLAIDNLDLTISAESLPSFRPLQTESPHTNSGKYRN
jgi:amidase